MKKWFFVLTILFILGCGILQFKPNVDNGITIQAMHNLTYKNNIEVTTDYIYQGNLLLVNKDHPVPAGSKESEAVYLSQHRNLNNGFVLLDDTIRLSPSLLEKFSAMIEAAKKDGVNRFMINSGYRDIKEQNELYEQMGSDYALMGGHSEHNLGLSLDIGSTQGEMAHAAEGKWLQENAWKYGFILRYPKDKTAITGIQYEPWHFRYVGLPHSAIMYEKDFVLEEYLAFLKEEKSIKTFIDKQAYEIHYYSVSKDTVIQVPEQENYEISGNNIDGVIVTVYSIS